MHKCPINACPCALPWNVLMCPRHWAMVPTPTQRRVWQTWNRGRPAPGYMAARTEAIDSVHQSLRSNSHE